MLMQIFSGVNKVHYRQFGSGKLRVLIALCLACRKILKNFLVSRLPNGCPYCFFLEAYFCQETFERISIRVITLLSLLSQLKCRIV